RVHRCPSCGSASRCTPVRGPAQPPTLDTLAARGYNQLSPRPHTRDSRRLAMPITVTCSGCSTRLTAPDSAAGKKVKCPKPGCGTIIPVPAPVAEPEPLPLDPDFDEPVQQAPKPKTKPARAVVEDEDDERSRSKRRRDDDDDDDDRDWQRKKKRR